MGEIPETENGKNCESMYGEQGNNENAKLTAEEAALKVSEANKIREIYRITNEIPETENGKNCRPSKDLRRNGTNGVTY